MYPSDFEAAEGVYSRVDEPLFLGLSPLLALILFLLLLAVAAGMFFLGRWHLEQSGDRDADKAPADIHKAILKASNAAMGASSNDLKSRAEALKAVIRERLGPVLDLAGGIAGRFEALENALAGEVTAAPDAHGAGHSADHDDRNSHGCTCATPRNCTCKPASVTINQVYVGGLPVAGAGGCGEAGHHHPGGGHDNTNHGSHVDDAHPDGTRHMTGPEQIDALSRAVRKFHDHWSDGTARIRELREARRAFSR
ncbi:hypothetical protein [Brevundimonas sp. DC300-4]|uniref:hypothetical protein n=1 Tax=unclassified Brevundimonas TaxID=2622653 RepID=UPI003CEDC0C5